MEKARKIVISGVKKMEVMVISHLEENGISVVPIVVAVIRAVTKERAVHQAVVVAVNRIVVAVMMTGKHMKVAGNYIR